MRKSLLSFVSFVTLALLSTLSLDEPSLGVRDAEAATFDICRYRSEGNTTYNGQAQHSLEFWWRRDTNAVIHDERRNRTTKWFYNNHPVATPELTNLGSVTGSDGITSPSSVTARFTINFTTGVPGLTIVVTGLLANGGHYAATPHVLSGIYYGSNQAWLSGVGVVTCGFS